MGVELPGVERAQKPGDRRAIFGQRQKQHLPLQMFTTFVMRWLRTAHERLAARHAFAEQIVGLIEEMFVAHSRHGRRSATPLQELRQSVAGKTETKILAAVDRLHREGPRNRAAQLRGREFRAARADAAGREALPDCIDRTQFLVGHGTRNAVVYIQRKVPWACDKARASIIRGEARFPRAANRARSL